MVSDPDRLVRYARLRCSKAVLGMSGVSFCRRLYKNDLLPGNHWIAPKRARSMESGNCFPVAGSRMWITLSSEPPGEIP